MCMFFNIVKVLSKNSFIRARDLAQNKLNLVYDLSHNKGVWFESKYQVIQIKSLEHIRTHLFDSSHALCDSNHMIRVMKTGDSNQSYIRKSMEMQPCMIWISLWFYSSYYDLNHGCCDSNHDNMKETPKHSIILIRFM